MRLSLFRKLSARKTVLNISGKEILLFTVFALLYLLSRYDYPIFHFLLETATMVIGFCMTAICINTDATSENSFYTLLGIAYGFVSLINIFHIAPNSGIGLLQCGALNYATQLRVIKIFMEAASFLIAAFYVNKKINIKVTFCSYLLISVGCLASVYIFRIFPVCYIDGIGLTKFKIASEYFVMVLLALAQVILLSKKQHFPSRIFKLLMLSIIFTQVSNLLSTMFVHREDWANIWAHMFKLFSFYIIYVAVIQTSFKNPVELFYKKMEEKNNELLRINEILKKSNIELQKSREEIKRNQEQYRKLVESFPEAVCILKDDRIKYYNKLFCDLLKIKDFNEVIDCSIYDVVNFQTPDIIREQLGVVEEDVNTPAVEESLLCSDGSAINIEFSALSTKIEAEQLTVIFMKDITQKKLAEELLTKERIEEENEKLRIEFFSNISHELRTPINIIYSILQLKDSSKRSGREIDLEKYFNIIKQNCFRLLRITNNLIDITKIDSGYFKPQLNTENIVELVENITLSTVPYAESKGISVTFDTSDEEIFVSCDYDLIERIILNLLSNSVKYGKYDGKILVEIQREEDFALIRIADDGVGIPEDKKALIFNRFMQVDRTFARNSEGSGIGLSLVKALVEIQDGTVSFNSKEGTGTEFIIRFPISYGPPCIMDNLKLNEQNNTINKVEIELSDIYYD